mmetsp:Transcript_156177/g.501041  ORF Transcript_156177/g.501041 Transcript_156177/m.501041 type:complete len:152 (+) Transcript_156177:433-888(+)
MHNHIGPILHLLCAHNALISTSKRLQTCAPSLSTRTHRRGQRMAPAQRSPAILVATKRRFLVENFRKVACKELLDAPSKRALNSSTTFSSEALTCLAARAVAAGHEGLLRMNSLLNSSAAAANFEGWWRRNRMSSKDNSKMYWASSRWKSS